MEALVNASLLYDTFDTPEVQLWCSGGRPAMFVLFIIFAFIQLFVYFLSCIVGHYRISTCELITGLVMNLAFSVVIDGIYCIANSESFFKMANIPMIIVPVFVSIFVFVISNCGFMTLKKRKKAVTFVRDLQKSPILTIDELEGYFQTMRRNYPQISITGYRDTTVYIQSFNLGTVNSVPVDARFGFKEPLPVATWQDTSIIDLTDLPMLFVCKCKLDFQLTEDMAGLREETETRTVDKYSAEGPARIHQQFDNLEDFYVEFIATNSRKKPIIYKIYKSCFYGFIRGLITVTGFFAIFDSIYMCLLKKRKFRITKNCSASNIYPHVGGMPDQTVPPNNRFKKHLDKIIAMNPMNTIVFSGNYFPRLYKPKDMPAMPNSFNPLSRNEIPFSHTPLGSIQTALPAQSHNPYGMQQQQLAQMQQQNFGAKPGQVYNQEYPYPPQNYQQPGPVAQTSLITGTLSPYAYPEAPPQLKPE